jgi:hypothetical protein
LNLYIARTSKKAFSELPAHCPPARQKNAFSRKSFFCHGERTSLFASILLLDTTMSAPKKGKRPACELTHLIDEAFQPGADDVFTTTLMPKKKKTSSGKPRPTARPYRRVDDAVLHSRIADMTKRSKTLRAKIVILEDRLGGHEQELSLRVEA